MLLVFYGKGKGKTTAAMGTVARALGRGWRVVVAQFMKLWESGERRFFTELAKEGGPLKDKIKWYSFGTKEFVNPNDLSNDVASINMATGYGFLLYVLPELLAEFKPKLVVLDELGIATHMGIVDEYTVTNILKQFAGNRNLHAIVTGRYVPSTIKDIADLVTQVNEVKHYFRRGILSLEGLDD